MDNNKKNILWYDKPAANWLKSLPIGNGRLGAMISGKAYNEVISLNEDTIWARGPEQRNNPDALKYLDEVRRLIMEGKPQKAQELAEVSMIGTPKRQPPYQPLGDLNLMFLGHQDDFVSEYYRELDMEQAIVRVGYKVKDINFNREIFCSAVDQCIIIRLTSDKQSSIGINTELFRKFDSYVHIINDNTISLDGQCGCNGTKFSALLTVDAAGGTTKIIGESIVVENADIVTLYLTAATNFRYDDYKNQCFMNMKNALGKTYEKIKEDHINEYSKMFNRVQFCLEGKYEEERIVLEPTGKRLERVRNGSEDLQLVTQYFQYARYLLISCSRPGSMAANLQGIWNDSMTPSWDSKYTININTEMNYWPAEICNLSECHEPLFELIDSIRESGRYTAKSMYNCRGFVAHHNTDLWSDTAPLDHTKAGLWPLGAAWLCYHLWEHYEYTLDKRFLQNLAYPVMKEAAEFFVDYLIEDKNGQLLSGPSLSPENRYRLPDGQIGTLCMSPAMDTQIIKGLFKRCIEAGELLNKDFDFCSNLKRMIERLPKMKIGRKGQLQEWMEDYEEVEPGHRHVSHLFGVYPDNQINNDETPELFNAARKSLEIRLSHGGGGTGWSQAWIVSLWARFKEGNLAYESILKLLRLSTEDNLFDLHPPKIFQIDGNFGAAAGIAEMLIQSHTGTIELLPALPEAWASGNIKGIRVRGGFEVDIKWANHKLEESIIYAHADNTCKVKLNKNYCLIDCFSGNIIDVAKDDSVIKFRMKKGEKYIIKL